MPKNAGFRYSAGTRTWSTSDVNVAAKLRSYCDTEASEAIDNETSFLAAREAFREAARRAADEEAAAAAKAAIEGSSQTIAPVSQPFMAPPNSEPPPPAHFDSPIYSPTGTAVNRIEKAASPL